MSEAADDAEPLDGSRLPARTSERVKAFTDAVVAIAMTLLVLPLLERVPEAANAGIDTVEFLQENAGRLFSFLLSFVVIATFWIGHHRFYDRIGALSVPLMWLNVAWMLTIVWLPVPTALVGAMPIDRLQAVLYIGTMLLTTLVMVVSHLVVGRRPELWAGDTPPSRAGLVAEALYAGLFALALVLTVVFPGAGYIWMFVLFLGAPLRPILNRRFVR